MIPHHAAGYERHRRAARQQNTAIIYADRQRINIDRVIGLEMRRRRRLHAQTLCYPRELAGRVSRRGAAPFSKNGRKKRTIEAAISVGELTLNPSTRSSE